MRKYLKKLEIINLVTLLIVVLSGCNIVYTELIDPAESLSATEEQSNDILHAGGSDGAPASDAEFNFSTFKRIEINFESEIENAEIRVFDDSGNLLADVKTGDDGKFTVQLSISDIASGIYLRSSVIGLPSEIYAEIVQNKVEISLLRTPNAMSSSSRAFSGGSSRKFNTSKNFPQYAVLGSWNAAGKPDYLITPKIISGDLIQEINRVIPELQPVPEFRPQYLSDTIDTDIHLTKTGEVFVTFVHEGAGYRNSLGFYTYITDDGPPTNIADESITLIYPNVSYLYSGGELQSGDRVKLGDFPAGTSIGWVLISNGYNTKSRSVTNGINKFFSENSLNPDPAPYQQHLIMIDLGEEIVLGFEDLVRPGGDNDFNDSVFLVESNPVEAISRSGLITDTSVNSGANTQNDTNDSDLNLTKDPLFEISGYQFFPGKDEFGSLAYEDLWPHIGDYDFNDLVIDYNIIETLDINNSIIQIQLKLRIVGILASMHNGFGFQLGVPPNLVASVNGAKYTRGYTKLAANGVETRQDKAVIIAFEDAQEHFNAAESASSELITISINFTRGISREELGFAPYNPFIMSNGERGREVHLPGYQPTSLVLYPYFSCEDDDSILGTSFMYKSESNLPWAIHLPETFAYSTDGVRIDDAFYLYQSWVNSDGNENNDWYTNQQGYRNMKYQFRD